MSEFSVSVVVLNYDGREWTKDCLNSVLNSDYPSHLLEIILLDNGSTEDDFEFFKKEFGQNPRIKLWHSEENLYFAEGSNLAASQAQGDFLVFLNNDAIVDKNWLKELLGFVDGRENILIQPKILLASAPDIIDNAGGRYLFPGFGFGLGRNEKDAGQYAKPMRVDFANGTCLSISRKLFEKLNGFDDRFRLFYEDVDLNLRAQKLGAESWLCPSSIIFHRGSLTVKNSARKDFLRFCSRKNRLLTVLKNFHGPEKWLRLILLLPFSLLTPASVWAVSNWQWRQLIEKIRFQELAKLIDKRDFSLLDIGSGDGVFARLAEENDARVVALDPAPHGYYFKTIKSELENFSSDEKFDAVTLFHVLEHTENPLGSLKKAVSFLKPGGVLALEVPLVGNLTEKFLGRDYFAYQDKSHRHFFNQKQIFELVKAAGLRIENQGFTLLEFPFHLITAGFKGGVRRGLTALAVFPLLKWRTILGKNKEIIRLYGRAVK